MILLDSKEEENIDVGISSENEIATPIISEVVTSTVRPQVSESTNSCATKLDVQELANSRELQPR